MESVAQQLEKTLGLIFKDEANRTETVHQALLELSGESRARLFIVVLFILEDIARIENGSLVGAAANEIMLQCTMAMRLGTAPELKMLVDLVQKGEVGV